MNKLLNIINDYLSKVEYSVNFMKEHYNCKDETEFYAIRRTHTKEAKINDNFEFSFHGLGCWVIYNGYEIDFDFVRSGGFHAFDLWRIQKFINSCDDYNKFKDEQLTEKLFNKLIKKGLIIKDHNLYIKKNS